MSQRESATRARIQVVDYSAARAKAIAWLGDRYLLAKPINRRLDSGRSEPKRASAFVD